MFTSPFFLDSPPRVAQQLLGMRLQTAWGTYTLIEVEAYGGQDDAASHAYRDTPRARLMIDTAGIWYVYLIYGMHLCVNITVGPAGVGGAVLLRGLEADDGSMILGPGKVSQALGVSRDWNGQQVDNPSAGMVWLPPEQNIGPVTTLPRVGIRHEKARLWRFRIR
jgi:DNA-3-methyladenine glycosylase